MHISAPLSRCLSSLRDLQNRPAGHDNPQRDRPVRPLLERVHDVVLRTWDLGFIAFGGPPVHFRILHQRFVEGLGGRETWVDEQTVSQRRCCRKSVIRNATGCLTRGLS